MESAFLKALENSAQDFVATVTQHQSRTDKFVLKSLLMKVSVQTASQICNALAAATSQEVKDYLNLLEQEEETAEEQIYASAPSPVQGRRGRSKRVAASSSDGATCLSTETEAANISSQLRKQRYQKLRNLRGCATLANLGLSLAPTVFRPSWLFSTVRSLHDNLVVLEADADLQDIISSLCEHWWRDKLDGNESLITQCLPYLLSKSLAYGRKKDVQRVYSMRHALALFDFFDDSIEDLKHLLIRTVITPAFLRSENGRRFISFLFGLNPQLVKELVVIVRSQIPFGRKSILEAYGEILYQAWKTAEDVCRYEIEHTCIQGLIEGALHGSSKALAASIRTVLEGFTSQKAQDGVESMLFRLLEPLLFRALQVANSNVRRNALLLFVDVFPVEDPHSSNEEKEALMEKQSGLLEKLLMDPSPEIRSVAVEVVCRILRLFWEIIPSGTTVKLLTKIVDEMAFDSTSNAVRVAVLKGVTYILENAQSHVILKSLLPRLGFLLNDNCLAVRIAAADLLLVIKGIRVIQFYKVVPVDSLLSSLSTDNSLVAQRLCKVLLPSYFPTKVSPKEACNRCVVLFERSPQAGIQFCKWLFSQGASGTSLLELVKTFAAMAKNEEECSDEVRTQALLALSEVCKSMLITGEWKEAIGEILTGDMLADLIACAPDSLGRSYVLQVASSLPPKNVSKLISYCGDLVLKWSVTPADVAEVQAVHALILAWGGLDSLLETFITILSESFSAADIASPRVIGVYHKLGNKRGKSARTNALDSTASKQDELKRQTLKDKFTAAVGAAWQVEILMSEVETREAVLANNHLKDLLHGLKNLAQNAVKLAGIGSPALTTILYPTSSVLAYMKMFVHIAVEGTRERERKSKKSSKGSKGQQRTRDSNPAALNDLWGGFEVAWEELISSLRKMLARTNLSPTSANSPSPQPTVKRPRLPNRRLRERGPLSPLPVNTSPGAEAKVRIHEGMLKIVAKVLQTASDAFALGLITSPSLKRESAFFISESIQWLVDNFLKGKGSGGGAHPAHQFKEFWAHSRIFATYAAKILYLNVRDNTNDEAEDVLMIADSLLNFIAVLDSLKGHKAMAVSVYTSLQQWIPDLLIATTQSAKRKGAERGIGGDPGSPSISGISAEGFRPWVAHLAVSAYESMAAVDNLESPAEEDRTEGRPTKSTENSCEDELPPSVPKMARGTSDENCQNKEDFLSILLRCLHRGHVQVLVYFIDILIRFAALSFAKGDYSSAIGSLDLTCRRLLMCKLPDQKGLDVVLKPTSLLILKDMRFQVGQASEITAETDRYYQNAETVRKFLTNIISCYDEFAL